ncbi:sigma 54-interacting transcriptional regulator [Lentibacillus cibarius]|uniref:PAS domain-containing protein n=1 Tax=Lentibacillus cibarius TaxID=2583219 RepID=A0A5S3QPP1_9BACI|nr:sigma 54-interacting transcriptional regulator [Lentibacillus cibarius]TMN23914.1 PAS domain-containing protein [Lentibacillus cibarius]
MRSIFAVPKNIGEDTFTKKIIDYQDQYLFLTENNQLHSYVDLKQLKTGDKEYSNLHIDQIVSNAVSIDKLGVFKSEQTLSLSFIFKALGEPIVLVKDKNNEIIGYLRREDMLACMFREETRNINILRMLLASIPMGLFVVDEDCKIVNYNESGLEMIRSTEDLVMGKDARNIFHEEHINEIFATGKTILNQIRITDKMAVLVDYSPIETTSGSVDGAIIIIQDLPAVEKMSMEIENVKNLNNDMNAILSTIYDELVVIDRTGEILRHSENYNFDFWDSELNELVGKNIFDMEEKGNISPSITKLVLERKQKVSRVQEGKNGKKVLAVGNPIFNEAGEMQRVVVASRDITENTKLKTELKQTKEMTKKYKEELNRLKNKTDESPHEIIYCSSKMKQIVNQIEKVARFSSTVLIQGESGVGKEMIAREIHCKSDRFNKPFLTLNCGSIPENLLESELFGYTKGAFTGANEKGKKGYFEQADGGVLFLDEIGDMPLSLQVKLLRVLQEGEVVPIGSVTATTVDVQIIAATNKDLNDMVEKGTFREDLFYRIHVIPIHVPPLNERSEDIPLLAYHTLQKLNQRYNKKCYFSPDALTLLESYSWPGNIRELQNFVERLFVTTEDNVISAASVDQILSLVSKNKTKPVISEVIPLQKAKEDVENQLIRLAMEKYGTTIKAAEALNISQSAVSRKYHKLLHTNE